MITEFYKANDCTINTDGRKELIPAEKQLANAEGYRDAAKLALWRSMERALINSINHLWRSGHVEFWEEDWFPGYEVFIEDIKALGYVVEKRSARRNECGMTQDYYRITLPKSVKKKED